MKFSIVRIETLKAEAASRFVTSSLAVFVSGVSIRARYRKTGHAYRRIKSKKREFFEAATF